MISVQQLRAISRRTGLNLYQQEKDYCLKMFLHSYYKTFQDAVFKGGTCLRYLYGIERFSEDLDFNLVTGPITFNGQVQKVLKDLGLVGMECNLVREETFEDAFTCEIAFKGPLHRELSQSLNKIRIDAGIRTGTLKEPAWRLIASEYAETRDRFMVLAMREEEMLVEKVAALMERRKGRDLYDVWFLLSRGVPLDKDLFAQKSPTAFRADGLLSKEEYERDMRRLAKRFVPYEQAIRDVMESLNSLEH